MTYCRRESEHNALCAAVYSGDVGLAVTQSMALTGMAQFGIRQSAEVASQLLSVERVLEYAGLPTEDEVHKSKGNYTGQNRRSRKPGSWERRVFPPSLTAGLDTQSY